MVVLDLCSFCRKTDQAASKRVKDTVLDDGWWERVNLSIKIMDPVDRPFSNGGQLMCHEVFIYVEDIIGSIWVSDTPASNFCKQISAPLRGLIM
jgi:hypothetical protein